MKLSAERYHADEWNIYAAQASDGDNWADDSPHCGEILRNNYSKQYVTMRTSKLRRVRIKVYGVSINL